MSEIIRGTGAGYYDIGASEPGTFPILVSGDSSSELQLSVIRTE
ncbi:MAG: hypothetical protein P8Y29_08115 [Gemmatimonadota bacterium]